MRIVLFVEGFTEKEAVAVFLKRWLDPRLARPVGIAPVRFNGWRDLFNGAAKKARFYLDGPLGQQPLGVVALFDLYGPTIYPSHLNSADQRYDWAVRHLEELVDRPGFRAFAAVHEVEAWLLSQPDLLPAPVRNGLPGRCERPETVNFTEPPAKLLDRLYSTHLHRGYKKRTYGRDLFGRPTRNSRAGGVRISPRCLTRCWNSRCENSRKTPPDDFRVYLAVPVSAYPTTSVSNFVYVS